MDKNRCSCVQNVECNVKECKHHTPENLCCAREIKVQNESAHRKSDTFCSTFECRCDM